MLTHPAALASSDSRPGPGLLVSLGDGSSARPGSAAVVRRRRPRRHLLDAALATDRMLFGLASTT
ncbi:hypothetical protein ACIP6Q_12390 [Streptomyces bobili]|uniref:hypothetical protein n=1 Tax=Streptomyces bobili TaxID=67280 RepID=UPI0036ED94D4